MRTTETRRLRLIVASDRDVAELHHAADVGGVEHVDVMEASVCGGVLPRVLRRCRCQNGFRRGRIGHRSWTPMKLGIRRTRRSLGGARAVRKQTSFGRDGSGRY